MRELMFDPRRLISLIRYRFFFFAGLLPFLLGQAMAFGRSGSLDMIIFGWALAGIVLVLIAVELFNEYFDAKRGGDRVFSLQPPPVPEHFLPAGLIACGCAGAIGLYLAWRTGWPVLAFAGLGFVAAYFYVGPPIRWAYRGFGELVIALSYGPFMILGSYFLQARTFSSVAVFTSAISGLAMFCLALLNEIPDFYQDRLVGKKNLVVRLGRRRALSLLTVALSALLLLLTLGLILRIIPPFTAAAMVMVPWVVKSICAVHRDCDRPEAFCGAVNTLVLTYIVLVLSLMAAFVV